MSLFRLYAERCAAAGKTPQFDQSPYFRFVHLAGDEKEAKEHPREALTWVRDLSTYRKTLTHGDEINVDLDQWRRVRPEAPPAYEWELENNTYFGTPDQCVAKIKDLQQQGIDYFGCNFSFGGMEHDKLLRSMELFSEEVMPHFK